MKIHKEKQGSLLSSSQQFNINDLRVEYFDKSREKSIDKINSLTKFTSRQNIAKIVAQYELFKLTRNVTGDIVEGGVYFGSGLFGWANIAVSLEPFNYQCKIIGFDTFKGSAGVSKKDASSKKIKRREGEYNANNYEDLLSAIKIYDKDRPLNHIKKIELIKGDMCRSIPKYVKNNQQQSIRILHLGMNLYKPTACALKYFLPLMNKGAIIGIDGLNHATPGCMIALREAMKNKKYTLRNFDFYPNFTYFQID